MGWERRSKNGVYYYRSTRRSDGSIQKRYLGNGAKARKEARRQAIKKAQREAVRKAVAESSNAMRLLGELENDCQTLYEAACLAAGFHRLNYGPWRRKRGRQ